MVATRDRLHALDAVRGFALLAGVVLHGAMSFLPGFREMHWPISDVSPSVPLGLTFFVIHIFRMTAFFMIAGFFARMTLQRRGPRDFIQNRALRIVVPLVVGWMVVFPLTVMAFSWAGTGSAGASPGATMPERPALAFPLEHLWFLYVLVWLYAVSLAIRPLIHRLDARERFRLVVDRGMNVLARTFLLPIALAIPVFIALTSQPQWARWFGIPTPDQSLIPNAQAAVAFTVAFAFGWIAERQRSLLETWSKQWAVHTIAAIALTSACLSIVGTMPVFTPAAIDQSTIVYAAIYSTASWAWTFAIIGMALRFCSTESRVVRYVSDASYWIYVMHLPLLFFLQAAVMNLPLHWSVKFPAILISAIGILFASYQACVRYTFIGEVLNGRRYRVPRPPSPSIAMHRGVGPVAELIEVRKKFGATVALDSVSLDLRPGELLAVLGPNGAGKSTAIGLLLGLIEPDAGDARLFGRQPRNIEARYGIGVMMQEVAVAAELKVRELIDLTISYYPSPLTVTEVLELTQTTELRDRPYGKLSTGQKRQVQFALAVCGRPAVLFLDEPTVGLDVTARETFWRAIRTLVAGGASIILTTHYLEEAEALADRVIVLARGGVIASGSVNDIRSVVDRKRLRCVTAISIEDIRSWPTVVTATLEGDAVSIVTTDADAVLRRLVGGDATARNIEVQRASLAEAFTELTKEAA